jgi:hypothetical protein
VSHWHPAFFFFLNHLYPICLYDPGLMLDVGASYIFVSDRNDILLPKSSGFSLPSALSSQDLGQEELGSISDPSPKHVYSHSAHPRASSGWDWLPHSPGRGARVTHHPSSPCLPGHVLLEKTLIPQLP